MRGTWISTPLVLAGVCCCVPCAEGGVYKCVGPDGKVAYQDTPCATGATQTSIHTPEAPAQGVNAPAQRLQAPTVPPGMYEAARRKEVPKNIDAKGALEAWDRFAKAFNRGDKATAMQQLTPGAQERYSPVFDALMSPGGAAVAPKK